MAIAAQRQATNGEPGRAWLAADELRGLAPLVRLLTEIWIVPKVRKIGVTLGEASIGLPAVELWVFMSGEDLEAEAAISRAERAFLNDTLGHGFVFSLNVVPDDDIPSDVIPPHTVLLER